MQRLVATYQSPQVRDLVRKITRQRRMRIFLAQIERHGTVAAEWHELHIAPTKVAASSLDVERAADAQRLPPLGVKTLPAFQSDAVGQLPVDQSTIRLIATCTLHQLAQNPSNRLRHIATANHHNLLAISPLRRNPEHEGTASNCSQPRVSMSMSRLWAFGPCGQTEFRAGSLQREKPQIMLEVCGIRRCRAVLGDRRSARCDRSAK